MPCLQRHSGHTLASSRLLIVHKPIAIAADYATGFCTPQVLMGRQERFSCANGRLRTLTVP